LRGGDPRVATVWLDVDPATLARRLDTREGHFAGSDLLASQFEALEPPSPNEAVRVAAEGDVDQVARRVVGALRAEATNGSRGEA
jgi:gluconate kinase